METLSSSVSSVRSLTNKALDTTDRVLTKQLGIFSNSYLNNVVLVALILYAPAAAPMLNASLVKFFGNYAVKLVYVFLLAYLLARSVKVALLTSVIVVVGAYLLKKIGGAEHFTQAEAEQEHELPKEPVIDRAALQKPASQQVETNKLTAANDVDHPHADADHSNSLQTDNRTQQLTQPSSDDVIDVCGSRLSSDGYSGYDEDSITYTPL